MVYSTYIFHGFRTMSFNGPLGIVSTDFGILISEFKTMLAIYPLGNLENLWQ